MSIVQVWPYAIVEPLPVLTVLAVPAARLWPRSAAYEAGRQHSSAPVSIRPIVLRNLPVSGLLILTNSHGRGIGSASEAFRNGKSIMGISIHQSNVVAWNKEYHRVCYALFMRMFHYVVRVVSRCDNRPVGHRPHCDVFALISLFRY